MADIITALVAPFQIAAWRGKAGETAGSVSPTERAE